MRDKLAGKVRAIWQKAYDAQMERLVTGARAFGMADLFGPDVGPGGAMGGFGSRVSFGPIEWGGGTGGGDYSGFGSTDVGV